MLVKSYEKSVKSLMKSKDFEMRTPFWELVTPHEHTPYKGIIMLVNKLQRNIIHCVSKSTDVITRSNLHHLTFMCSY